MNRELRCLLCYEPVNEGEVHPKCSLRLYGRSTPPELNLRLDDLEEMAAVALRTRGGVTGVQPKLSLDYEESNNRRLTVVGLGPSGQFILKPPTSEFPSLPENESLTMHLAEAAGIRTAHHGLIRLADGVLAYIVRRFDRTEQGEKLAMEDMCQLAEKLTEEKYNGSQEMVGRLVRRYSSQPGYDALVVFDLALFCYLTGNADMHLKNFALIEERKGNVVLAPAYDLVNTAIAVPEDREESALTVNGKRGRLRRKDFDALAVSLGIPERAAANAYRRLEKAQPAMEHLLHISFLSQSQIEAYGAVISERSTVLFGE